MDMGTLHCELIRILIVAHLSDPPISFRCMYPGRPFTLFPPHLPLTSANICAFHALSPDTRQCFAVPYVIKVSFSSSNNVLLLFVDVRTTSYSAKLRKASKCLQPSM